MGNIILSHDGDSVDLTDWATAQLNLTPMQVEKLVSCIAGSFLGAMCSILTAIDIWCGQLNDKASKDYFTAVFGALANQC